MKEIVGYGFLWALIALVIMWFVFAGIDRHMALAEAQGVERMRGVVVKERMRYHGARAAHLAEDGLWYFRDGAGRLCRLW